jgi:multidrug efflux system outer membrane protein
MTAPQAAGRWLALAAALLAGCNPVGPAYKRPDMPTPEAFKEAGPWRAATPQDAMPKGDWWEIFQDPALNELQARAHAGNLRLQAAAARVDQARAIAGGTQANALPTVELAPDVARYRVSGNRPDQPSKIPGNEAYTTDRFRLPLYASYEVDLWGKLRRTQESADARLAASQAAYATVLLGLEGEVAQTYFLLRTAEEDARILGGNLELRRRARDLVAARTRNGLATPLDLARLDTEVALTEADLQVVRRRRAELEHALAVLVGEPPERFALPEGTLTVPPPVIPPGLPAQLLERRPDVAEAERLLVARNAEIGVAQAAFFPAIRLTGAIGYESAELSDLLDADSLIWSMGAALVQPVFDGGRLRANRERAEAAYRENLALYRERLLVAFREVDDALAGLRYLGDQETLVRQGVDSAQRAEQLAQARYRAGLVTVLEVVDAQRTRLGAERQRASVVNQQLLASVALVKALGGGWEGAQAGAAAGDAASGAAVVSLQQQEWRLW